MNYSVETHKLIGFIENHSEFKFIKSNYCFYNNHLGAILTDIILQAGLNYNSVVFPRVIFVYENYPKASDLQGLLDTLSCISLSEFLQWNHCTKLSRYNCIIEFMIQYKITDSYRLCAFLLDKNNKEKFLNLPGIGKKTLDYFFKLMGSDVVAVDRHILTFLDKANIAYKDYNSAKKIVEYTADILGVSRKDIDFSIWSYISAKSKN